MAGTKIGLILYTLRDFLGDDDQVARTLERVKKTGYDAIELAGTGGASLATWKKRIAENELDVVSSHCGWGGLTDEFDSLVDQTKELGCSHLVVGSMPGEYRSAEGYQHFAKMASEMGMRLAERGMTYGYHNHSFEFTHYDGRAGQEILRDESDPKYFNFEIDTYWIQHGGGDPAAWIDSVAGRVPTVHMKDFIIHDGQAMFAEVGEGNLNWPAILAACKRAEVKYHIVEQDRCLRDPFDSIAISIKNMKSWGLR